MLSLFWLLLPSAGNYAFTAQSIKTVQSPPRAFAHDASVDPAIAEASSRLQQGKPTEADSLLRSYLSQQPDSADAHFLLGHALLRQIQEGAWSGRESNAPPREEKAKTSLAEFSLYLHQAIQISPRDSKTHQLLGKAFARLGRFPEAQAEKAVQLAPENANLVCILGPIYRKQGLNERGKIELDRCASLNGTNCSPEKPRP